MHLPRRIKVKGIIREEIATDQLAMVYFLMGKAAVQAKRRRAAAERERRTQEGATVED
jgi:hypothetical protein